MLLNELAELLVGGVYELQGGDAAAVTGAWVGAGLEHHLDEGVAKLSLGRGFRVEPANGSVQRCVALEAVDGVALEVGLVKEEVDDFIYEGRGSCVRLEERQEGEPKSRLRKDGENEQFPREAASW